jgi:hypothetical protein
VIIKPYAKNLRYNKQGDRIVFTIRENGGYLFELDDYHEMLYIFHNKPILCESPAEVTHYFGRGVHFAGKLVLHSGESVYLDKDALVYGSIYAEDSENIRIYGNGIFDDSGEERFCEHCYENYTNGNIKLYDCKNVKIEGVGFVNSAIWCVNLFHCADVTLDGIRVFGQWRYNTDGVDIVNSKNVILRNSFIHSFDDTVAIKGIDRYGAENNENILVENCVLACDWGKTMEIGFETECREYRNIVFRNCHVVRGGNTACDIQNGNCATIFGLLFENIFLELESFYPPEQLQLSEDQTYDKGGEIGLSYLFKITNYRFRDAFATLDKGIGDQSEEGQPHFAAVRDVTVRNVNVYADGGVLSAFGTACVRIGVENLIPTTEYESITVENVFLNGVRLCENEMDVTVSGCKKGAVTVR